MCLLFNTIFSVVFFVFLVLTLLVKGYKQSQRSELRLSYLSTVKPAAVTESSEDYQPFDWSNSHHTTNATPIHFLLLHAWSPSIVILLLQYILYMSWYYSVIASWLKFTTSLFLFGIHMHIHNNWHLLVLVISIMCVLLTLSMLFVMQCPLLCIAASCVHSHSPDLEICLSIK